jgi:hypothetical protein
MRIIGRSSAASSTRSAEQFKCRSRLRTPACGCRNTSLHGFDIRRQARTTRSEVDSERHALVKRVRNLSHAHLADVLQSVLGLKQEIGAVRG